MKLQILSDLHLETCPYNLQKSDADVLVLAGDIDRAGKGLEWGMANWPDKPLIYVLGNHEYHGYSFSSLASSLKQKTINTNAHLLENDFITLEGVRIFGATLWTDYHLIDQPEESMRYAEDNLKDHKNIYLGDFGDKSLNDEKNKLRKLKSKDKLKAHKNSLKILAENGPADIVITHHAPSKQSIPPRRWSLRSSSSASPLEDRISQLTNKLWIHGHTHISADYEIDGRRVVSNPRGYIPHEPNDAFQDIFTVEV